MKVLLTGGAGFIGSHTTDLLLKEGYEVSILDNLEPPVHPQKNKPDYISEEVDFILGDVRNRSDVEKALRGVEVVFHLAAYQGYLTDFSKFASTNDVGTALIYQVIVEKRLPIRKVILGSSQAVYGEGKYECLEHGMQYPPPRSLEQLRKGDWEVKCPICQKAMQSLTVDELRVNPHNQYAISKYAQELYALTLGKRFDIPTVALRYSITQGPRQSFYNAYSGILRIFSIRLFNNLPPIIYEDGNQLRDYVYVGDVVRANVLVMENERANYEVYNVGGSEVLSVSDYVRLLQRVTGKNITPQIPGEFRFGDTRHVVSNIKKLTELGWKPSVSLEQTIKEYTEWAETQSGISDYYAKAEKTMKQRGIIQVVKQ